MIEYEKVRDDYFEAIRKHKAEIIQAMAEAKQQIDIALEKVAPERRDFIRRLLEVEAYHQDSCDDEVVRIIRELKHTVSKDISKLLRDYRQSIMEELDDND